MKQSIEVGSFVFVALLVFIARSIGGKPFAIISMVLMAFGYVFVSALLIMFLSKKFDK